MQKLEACANERGTQGNPLFGYRSFGVPVLFKPGPGTFWVLLEHSYVQNTDQTDSLNVLHITSFSMRNRYVRKIARMRADSLAHVMHT